MTNKPCGCKIVHTHSMVRDVKRFYQHGRYREDPPTISYCKKHASADRMLEFIKKATYFDEENLKEARSIVSEIEKENKI